MRRIARNHADGGFAFTATFWAACSAMASALAAILAVVAVRQQRAFARAAVTARPIVKLGFDAQSEKLIADVYNSSAEPAFGAYIVVIG
jgi:hypothetical protein